MVDEHADEPEPLALDKYEVKKLLQEGGATKEDLEDFDERYDDSVGEKSSFLASNISSARKFEIKTPDVVIQVNPGTHRPRGNPGHRRQNLSHDRGHRFCGGERSQRPPHLP